MISFSIDISALMDNMLGHDWERWEEFNESTHHYSVRWCKNKNCHAYQLYHHNAKQVKEYWYSDTSGYILQHIYRNSELAELLPQKRSMGVISAVSPILVYPVALSLAVLLIGKLPNLIKRK